MSGNFHKSSNSTSKMIMSGTETVILNAKTQQLILSVHEQVKDFLIKVNYDAIEILNYIISKDTPVCQIKDAPQKLKKLGLEEGLIFELSGFQALQLNLMLKAGFRFSTIPLFVLDKKPVAPFTVFHDFYKWYSYKKNLPGFDRESQRLFRLSLINPNAINMSKLTLDQLAGLQEAIKRDQEATDFTIAIIKEQEAAQALKEKGESKA